MPTTPQPPPDIRVLVLDVDGVLTDGRLPVDEQGRQLRAFHVHDGFAIRCFLELGGEVVICSGKRSPAVDARATELGIRHVLQGSRDKLADIQALLPSIGVSLRNVVMVGDDLPDVPLMRACAAGVAVASAVDEVRAAATWVTPRPGGHGAVRDAIEWLLRADGRWNAILSRYGVAAPG